MKIYDLERFLRLLWDETKWQSLLDSLNDKPPAWTEEEKTQRNAPVWKRAQQRFEQGEDVLYHMDFYDDTEDDDDNLGDYSYLNSDDEGFDDDDE